jgi:hypothetical protein
MNALIGYQSSRCINPLGAARVARRCPHSFCPFRGAEAEASALHSAQIAGDNFFGGQIPRRFMVAARGTPVGDKQKKRKPRVCEESTGVSAL